MSTIIKSEPTGSLFLCALIPYPRQALARLAGLVRHEDVVTELTQSLDHGITEILVRV
jgi:hypothetical protein